MGLLDKLNGHYSLTTQISKRHIVSLIDERIERAKRSDGWFVFEDVNYKKFILNGNDVVITRLPATFSSFRALGTIKISLSDADNETLINVTIIPYGEMQQIVVWFLAIALTLFTLFAVWLFPYSAKYWGITIAWLVVSGHLILTIKYYRYALKIYLKKVLEDLGIAGDLKSR